MQLIFSRSCRHDTTDVHQTNRHGTTEIFVKSIIFNVIIGQKVAFSPILMY